MIIVPIKFKIVQTDYFHFVISEYQHHHCINIPTQVLRASVLRKLIIVICFLNMLWRKFE